MGVSVATWMVEQLVKQLAAQSVYIVVVLMDDF